MTAWALPLLQPLFFTGGEAPPPPRPYADASPPICIPRLGITAGAYFLYLRRGPTPGRDLPLMPRLGFPCPRLGMAAGAYFLYWRRGPTPGRDLPLMPRLGFPCP